MGGRDKLLEPINGEPLLARQARRARATGCDVAVMVPGPDHPRASAVAEVDVSCHLVPDAAEGMSASLRTAARLCGTGQPLLILLPDVPGIGTDDLTHVLGVFERLGSDSIVQAQGPKGRPGTPVVFPARLLSAFDTLAGDDGARAIILSEEPYAIRFEDDRATRDLDSPEDWEKWRSDTGITG